MQKNKEIYSNFKSEWIKYDDYIIAKDKNHELYIKAKDNSSYKLYNPFDEFENIVTDIINIGLTIRMNKKLKNDDKNELLLDFTRKYGLLGLAGSSVINRDIIDEESVLFNKTNLLNLNGIMAVNKYIKMFIPFAKEDEVTIKKYKNDVSLFKAEDSPKFYGKKPLIFDLIFSKFYCEKIEWIESFALLLSQNYSELSSYKKSSKFLTEEVTIMPTRFNPGKISWSLTQGKTTNMQWEFDSLKTSIETIYGFLVTNEKNILKTCNHCGLLFYSQNKRKLYCDESCRNRANVYKSRRRNAK